MDMYRVSIEFEQYTPPDDFGWFPGSVLYRFSPESATKAYEMFVRDLIERAGFEEEEGLSYVNGGGPARMTYFRRTLPIWVSDRRAVGASRMRVGVEWVPPAARPAIMSELGLTEESSPNALEVF